MAEFSPMMQHYLATKNKYKDCILFYRLGDFYEMFFEDAINVSRELELTLTGKECGQEERAPMCGIPYHAAETYIAKLITNGHKVAICEQLEDPKKCKGIVKRDVIRIVTPGTVTETNLLEDKKNNYIMSIYKEATFFGLAICDISTGDFYATQIKEENNFQRLLDEISKYNPSELIINKMLFNCESEIKCLKERFKAFISTEDEEKFSSDGSKIYEQYSLNKENGETLNDLESMNLTIPAINGLISYIEDTQKIQLQHLNKIVIYIITKYMSLDINARRNLEITEKLRDKTKKGTLLWVLDKTSTAMGGRLLRKWVNEPLVDVEEINNRLEAVKELKENIMLRGELTADLKNVYDIERLAGKISYGNINAREMNSLKASAKKLPDIKKMIENTKSPMLQNLYKNLDTLEDIHKIIDDAIIEDPPITITDGGIIKMGFDPQIDELKTAMIQGKNWIIELEAKEREETGIKGLKVGYNKVFGYYIEITKSNLGLAPERYIRKQTLTNGERYITEELKTLEEKILGAEEKVISLEYNTFVKIRDVIKSQIERVQRSANIIATIDVLCSLANVAEDLNYCMPKVDESGIIDIKDGRHPVIEKMVPAGNFIANDTYMDKEENRLAIITGPNMAGKSTYMRQIALITLMAQIGSFVPATSAHIGVVDKIFTRVGASDDLAMGQSTFMVEMTEVANILKEATKNSLVILDEIGRGTSTYDGLSIAWAVAEYIADKEKCGAKTAFATHYHELVDLEGKIDGVKNYSIAVKEKGEDIIFLRKIVPQGTDESYGVHVAQLAGVPKSVTKRANEILKSIERRNVLTNKKEDKKIVDGQLDMYNFKLAELAHEIDKININEITPIEALNSIVKLKEALR